MTPGLPAPAFTCRIARDEHERAGHFALRRQIFCDEQRLFVGSDRDEVDDIAFPIVCVVEPAPRVVGVVRIWEEAPGLWWGGRLGVHPELRSLATLGRALVQTAVGTARAWGARQFRATVQRPNVAFFRRLHWQSLEVLQLHGQEHHLMEAQLDRYAPTAERRSPEGARDAAA
jgi:putative N-acetyltransferase (TIGR04045 family)